MDYKFAEFIKHSYVALSSKNTYLKTHCMHLCAFVQVFRSKLLLQLVKNFTSPNYVKPLLLKHK